ncbi:S8 family serine peptidase [Dyadobacter sp. CY261]|uniref:S8 family serine peptidase n=1 Tax=Dyadobacter sp. CY261 TaxID=2907203 RepID=UPI001F4165D2|nr:S8 family serine peptidase [Dyadobacter sp. CY261]MCF0068870.1 S8 family serine peptidase [Dyadobacter sp. CY261]
MALTDAENLIPVPVPPVQFQIPQLLILDREVDTLIRTVEARRAFRVSGAGLTVAVLDTGLRVTHQDFAGRVPTQRNFTADNNGDPNNASDGNGHGTNVAGIIVASGLHNGIAPMASVIPLKVLSNNGGGSFEAVVDALDWVLDNHLKYNITVVSLSLGNTANYAGDEEFRNSDLHERILQLKNLRIPVVIAAGNEYFRFQQQGMSFPAIIRECVSVGAVYDANVGPRSYQSGAQAETTAADCITPFSQRLHQTSHTHCRTDIFAPGAPITSSGISSDMGESVQDGTSQATPVISGVLMLMQEYFLKTTRKLPEVDFLVECLRNGAVKIHDGDDEVNNVTPTRVDYLRVDALDALDAVRRQLQIGLLATASPLQFI